MKNAPDLAGAPAIPNLNRQLELAKFGFCLIWIDAKFYSSSSSS